MTKFRRILKNKRGRRGGEVHGENRGLSKDEPGLEQCYRPYRSAVASGNLQREQTDDNFCVEFRGLLFGEQCVQVCQILHNKPTGAEKREVEAIVTIWLLSLRRWGLVRAHRVGANDAHTKCEQVLSDILREPGVVKVVVRGPFRVGVGGRGGGGSGSGSVVPVTAPACPKEYRNARADTVSHGLDGFPGDTFARFLVGDVQDEAREYECA